MTTTRGSAHYAGLLPVPARPTTLENDRFPNEQPSLRKRALHAVSLLIAFCAGAAATCASWSYGEAARQIIASSHPQLGWLAPRVATTAQKTPNMVALIASAAPFPDQRQLDAMLGDDLHAMRLSLDRIVAGQELIARSIDEIATSIAAGQDQMTRTGDQTAATVAKGQEQMRRNTDQTTTSIDQAPSKATSLPIESRGDGASLQPTVRLNTKPTEAKPPQTLSEKGRPLSVASLHDTSCFPSASAVVQKHPGGWPTWTLKAPGHEGTMCWYASARSRGRDHRSEMVQRKEIVGTTANELSPPPAPYTRPPE